MDGDGEANQEPTIVAVEVWVCGSMRGCVSLL